jgi:sugar-specific transcriptional regulator TrmB
MPPIAAPELNVGQDKAPKMPGAFGKTNPTAKSTFKLYKGATVAADILFTESDNAAMKIVHELIGIDKLAGTISLGADNFSLTALIPGQVNISTGSGSDLVLSEAYFGMSIVGPETTFQIAGSSTFHLFGKTREIEVKLAVDEAAAVANVHLRDIPLPSPPPLPGVIMKEECWLEVGAQFEPPGLDLGFMGSFYIGDNPEEYAGEAVFVMELIEGVPNPLYVKFSINRLDLWAMFEAMTGMMHRIDQVEDLVNEGSDTESGLEFLKHMYQNLKSVLKLVALENVSFHWSDSIVILPDGSTAMPGVGFRGTLDLFGWKTFAAFEFSVAVPTQLSARFEMHSIHLNHVLSITGDGQGVLKREATGEEPWDKWKHSSKWVEKGAKIRTKTGENPVGLTKVVPTSGAEYIIPPGGPVFIVSSHHSPFLHADMKVALFDLLHAEVKADVDMNGLSFEIKTGIGGISELDLTCKIGTHGSTHFEASGRFSVHLNVNIPIDLPLIPKFNIPLSAGLDAEIDLRITDSEFDCVIQGSFEFEGVELHMPKIELDVPFDSFSKLPEIIITQIISNADEIFADVADLLEDLAKIAAKEVEKVGDEVADGAKAIGDGAVKLEEAIGKGADEAFNAAEHEVDAAANKLTQAADDIVDSTLGQMGVIGEVAGVAVKELLNDAKVVMDKAIEAVAAVSHEVIKDIEAITHAIADVAAFAAHAVAKIAADVAIAVQAVFDVARKAAHEIMKAAKAVLEGLKDAAKAVWNTIAEVGKKLADIAKAVLRGIEDAARAISSALASIFHGW